jgi:hypothetical protein
VSHVCPIRSVLYSIERPKAHASTSLLQTRSPPDIATNLRGVTALDAVSDDFKCLVHATVETSWVPAEIDYHR